MQAIPLLHATQAYPFIEFLNQAGCNTHKLSKKASLPGRLTESCGGYITEGQLWELLDIAARDEDIDHFGLANSSMEGMCQKDQFQEKLEIIAQECQETSQTV